MLEIYLPKSKKVAYLLWLFLGLVGAHRWYLFGLKWSTIVFTLTLGCFGIGWIADLCQIGSWLENATVTMSVPGTNSSLLHLRMGKGDPKSIETVLEFFRDRILPYKRIKLSLINT